MTIDFSGLSARDLHVLITQAEKQQTKILTRPKASAMRAKINKYVKDHGYTIEELYVISAGSSSKESRKIVTSKNAKGRKLGKAAPKYRNPANPDETWAGRGRQPRWMTDLVAKGSSPQDFLIK